MSTQFILNCSQCTFYLIKRQRKTRTHVSFVDSEENAGDEQKEKKSCHQQMTRILNSWIRNMIRADAIIMSWIELKIINTPSSIMFAPVTFWCSSSHSITHPKAYQLCTLVNSEHIRKIKNEISLDNTRLNYLNFIRFIVNMSLANNGMVFTDIPILKITRRTTIEEEKTHWLSDNQKTVEIFLVWQWKWNVKRFFETKKNYEMAS